MTNKEEIFDLISNHPEGLDDDDIAEMTGIQPRQQVQQLCNQLADSKRIRKALCGKEREAAEDPQLSDDGHRGSCNSFGHGFEVGELAPAPGGIGCGYWSY
jgi:hypothetical protein